MKNILVATDFSDASRLSLRYAQALAAHYHSDVYIVNVTGSGLFPFLPPEQRENAIREAGAKMRDFLAGSKSSPAWKQIVRGGEPSDVLYETARELQADLLVLGTTGRRGLKRFVLGSVAEEIFRAVPCPVLTVGPKAAGRDARTPMRRILFATDLAPSSLQALPYAMRLAHEHQAALVLMHTAPTAQAAAAAKAQMEELAAGQEHSDVRATILVETGPPAATILHAAASTDSDLIVLGIRSGGSWSRVATHAPGPVAYEVIAQAVCPVLTLRSENAEA